MQTDDQNNVNNGLTQEEMERLYDRFWKPVYRYILARISHVETAEDLASSAMLRFYTYVQSHPLGDHHHSGLIYTIAKGLIVDHYKQRQRTMTIDIEEVDVASDEIPLDQQTDDTMRVELLRKVLPELPELLQELIILRCVKQLEYSEIAELLGKKEGAIRVGVHRAMKMLTEKMTQKH